MATFHPAKRLYSQFDFSSYFQGIRFLKGIRRVRIAISEEWLFTTNCPSYFDDVYLDALLVPFPLDQKFLSED